MKNKLRLFNVSIGRMMLATAVVVGLVLGTAQPVAATWQWPIIGPAGSGSFGASVTSLPNGNIVVTDPSYDDGATADVGAVYLYDGATRALISTLTGSTTGDQVGTWVTVLSNGNYAIASPYWDNGTATDVGAVTWGSAAAGISGVVSAANSLVGSTAGDQVGCQGYMEKETGVTALNNGNYVVSSPYWDNGPAADAGAATWGSGTTSVSGAVSAANSLVGSTTNDGVGFGGVMVLSNGNYVVGSPSWDNGPVAEVGAATWGNGTTGAVGVVSPANSLVGSMSMDWVGSSMTALTNGNYVVRSLRWGEYAGAVTWGNGTVGTSGVVSVTNSLVGTSAYDGVGTVTALSNGNYVVTSPGWDNGDAYDAGAATWGDGAVGTVGEVSVANSLVGDTGGAQIGSGGVTVLGNGNYVVNSPNWNNGAAADAGAATWGSGTTGISGVASAANSLVGSTALDQVGWCTTALSNGNYVVVSAYWDDGAVADVGAATWGSGTTGIIGPVSTANSLVGGTAGDRVGCTPDPWGDCQPSVTSLNSGNYVVGSPWWDNVPPREKQAADAGAVTWGNGTAGSAGVVSVANSLVGCTANDSVGSGGVTALSNGNYVVISPYWDNMVFTENQAADAGAVTYGNGTTGSAGVVSAVNSLVGSAAYDRVGFGGVTALSNGNYVVQSPWWDNGGVVDARAVTWGDGAAGAVGPVSTANSLVGSTADDEVGSGGVTALSDGNYVVLSPRWDNGGLWNAGAVTWGNEPTGVVGLITRSNSVGGTAAYGGEGMVWAYDYVNSQLVVGRPADQIVTLLRLTPIPTVYLPVILKDADPRGLRNP